MTKKYYWQGSDLEFVKIYRATESFGTSLEIELTEIDGFKIHGPFDTFTKARVHAVNYYRDIIKQLQLNIFNIYKIKSTDIS